MAGDTESSAKDSGSNAVDYNSPYYLHPSNYPRQMQVNDALSDKNYTDWVQEMENFLFAKNKIGFIDGSIKKPEKTSKDYMPWMIVDAMIKGWLTTAMEKEIRSSVKYANIAAEMWSDLCERFGKESAPRAYELKNKIAATRQDGATVSAYYTKLRSIWDEMQSVFPPPQCTCNGCTCGVGKKLVAHQEKERLYEFLMGLDNEFGVIKTQILATNPIPNLGKAYHLVAEDERQKLITEDKKTTVEAAAFKDFVPKKRDSSLSSQQKMKVHPKQGKQEEGIQHCTYCDRDGHNREGCFKRIGYPEWWPGKAKGDKAKPKASCVEGSSSPIPGLTVEQYNTFLKHFECGTITGDEGNKQVANMAGRLDDWIVDSGATEHTTYLSDILVNKRKDQHEMPVIIPNGDTIPVEGKGDYTLPGGTKTKGSPFEELDWSG